MTTGKIKNTAVESISGTLRGTNLDRLVQFVDGNRLVYFVTQHMPGFWLNDQLYAALLHEMRAPLSAAAGAASLLTDYRDRIADSPDKVAELAQRIQRDIEVAQRLTEQHNLLHRDNLDVKKQTVPAERVLRDTVERFQALVSRRSGRRAEARFHGALGTVHTDPKLLQQVMFNVLSNADRHCSGQVPIEIEAVRSGPHVIVRVRNDGPGIAPNTEELIFQPFYTTSPNGPGLGLYIARKLLSSMGADIRVTNQRDPTEVSLYLPTDAGADNDTDTR